MSTRENDLSAQVSASQKALFSTKFDQLLDKGLAALKPVEISPNSYERGSDSLAQLARLQYKYEGFPKALATLQHPKIRPSSATQQAGEIASEEIALGNRENAVAVLDLATEVVERIPDDRDGRGSERFYSGLAYRYALLGEKEKAMGFVSKLDSDEWIVVGTAEAFARGGYDSLAFEVIERAEAKDKSGYYGAVAWAQAERGDITAWQDTVDAKIGNKKGEGLRNAFYGLASYYYNQGDFPGAKEATIKAYEALGEPGEVYAGGLVKFALEKLQDPDVALTMAREMKADINGVDALAGVARMMLAKNRPEEAQAVIKLTDERAEEIIETRELYQWVSSLTKLQVADLYLQSGQTEEGMKRISAAEESFPALERKRDVVEVIEKLIEDEYYETATTLIPRIEPPITQAVLYEQVVDRMQKKMGAQGDYEEKDLTQEERERAREILDKAAVIVRNEARQEKSEVGEYISGHLVAVGESYAKLGDGDKAKDFFELAGEAAQRTENRADYNLRQIADREAKSGHFGGAVSLIDQVKDPSHKFHGYVDVVRSLIDKERLAQAGEILIKAEEVAEGFDPTKNVGGIPGEPQLMLAAQYYRLIMLTQEAA